MAVKKSSAVKRYRQSEERRLRNKAAKSAVRTSVKKLVVAVQQNNASDAEASLKEMIKKLDTASGKKLISKNAAARKKSRMQKMYNAFVAAQK